MYSCLRYACVCVGSCEFMLTLLINTLEREKNRNVDCFLIYLVTKRVHKKE